MTDDLLKVCPKCLMLAELSALRCGSCGHLFRLRPTERKVRQITSGASLQEEPQAAPASFVVVWTAARTIILLAIVALLCGGAALAGRADCTGLHGTCAVVGFFTGVGALCSVADLLTLLRLRASPLDRSAAARPLTAACPLPTR